MGVDGHSAAINRFSIDSAGSLLGGTPTSINFSAGAVVARTDGSNLYVLSANAKAGMISGSPIGGWIDHIRVLPDGALTSVGGFLITANIPTDLVVVRAN